MALRKKAAQKVQTEPEALPLAVVADVHIGNHAAFGGKMRAGIRLGRYWPSG